MPNNIDTPVVPEYITVHLGLPDQPAENVRVPFVAYIKNVASSEIYPNWPESAIHANILAQISYAMNRIYTEYYRSRGYDFDITSTTQYDQKFILNRDIFENISQIVDHIFNEWYRAQGYDFDITNSTRYDQSFVPGRDIFENISTIVDDMIGSYLTRGDAVEPLFAQYCNGTTSTCPGLSQWGTVGLARQGLVPYEILQRFYGDDINIVFNAPVGNNEESYPGVALRLGSIVESVRVLQRELNRIGDNYPAIPRIPQISVYYDLPTENAVRAFQKIFNLTPDGVVGKATWYKIKLIYSGIKQLNELMSEGITPEDAERFYPPELKEGDSGKAVEQMQNLLTIIAYFDNSIPLPAMNGVFDARTKNSLMAFQTQYGLEPTGVLNRQSANMLLSVYRDTRAMATENGKSVSRLIYPGRAILRGRTGADVEDLQSLINRAAAQNAFIPQVAEDGIFGEATENAVKAVQAHEGLDVNGIVGPLTWQALLRLSGLSP